MWPIGAQTTAPSGATAYLIEIANVINLLKTAKRDL
jgi:hypothetical protein